MVRPRDATLRSVLLSVSVVAVVVAAGCGADPTRAHGARPPRPDSVGSDPNGFDLDGDRIACET